MQLVTMYRCTSSCSHVGRWKLQQGQMNSLTCGVAWLPGKSEPAPRGQCHSARPWQPYGLECHASLQMPLPPASPKIDERGIKGCWPSCTGAQQFPGWSDAQVVSVWRPERQCHNHLQTGMQDNHMRPPPGGRWAARQPGAPSLLDGFCFHAQPARKQQPSQC